MIVYDTQGNETYNDGRAVEGGMTLYYPDGDTFAVGLFVDDDSRVQSELMGEDMLSLLFSAPQYIAIPTGVYATWNGIRYTLYRPANITKHHSRNYDYTLEMHAPYYGLTLRKFRNVVINYGDSTATPPVAASVGGDKRLVFPLTATPKEHIQMVVDNLNSENVSMSLGEANWTVGDCIDWNGTTDSGTEKLISYDKLSVYDALALIADTFETEFYFDYVGRTVSLGILEANKSVPLPMSYGKGNGFVSGIGCAPDGDLPPIGRLFVVGGERNINPSKYGRYDGVVTNSETRVRPIPSRTLLLPFRGELWYNGESFAYSDPIEREYRHYIVSSYRDSVVNADNCTPDPFYELTAVGETRHPWIEDANLVEDGIELSEVYPKHELTVFSVSVEDAETNLVNIFVKEGHNSSSDAFFNWIKTHTIGGEKPTVIFQSGELAGREFDLHTSDSNGTIDADYMSPVLGWRLKLVPVQTDGIWLPGGNPEDNYDQQTQTYTLNDAYMPHAGDSFAIFGIEMPANPYLDDGNYGGAEWDLFRKAVEYLYPNESEAYTFSGVVDSIWATNGWQGDTVVSGGLSARMKIGNYIVLTDNIMHNLPMRITAVSSSVNNPHDITLTLSNIPVKSGFRVRMIRAFSRSASDAYKWDALHSSAIGDHATLFRTMAKVNEVIERVNDDKTLFNSLSASIASFNSAQSQGGGNTISFSSCIENGIAIGTPQSVTQCKIIPTIESLKT